MEKNKSILFIGLHRPNRSPSQRYRFEQYIPYFKKKGFYTHQLYFLGEKTDRFYYYSTNVIIKLYILLKSVYRLFKHLWFKHYDVVFVQREAFMLGTAFFEKQFVKKNSLIFDFDDSIWIPQSGEIMSKNKKLYFLKDHNKTSEIIKIADLVIAGNSYLADYAKRFNHNTIIIPTTIDTDKYDREKKEFKQDKICIGWTGSFSTIIHFKMIEKALKILKENFKDKIYFKVIGDVNYNNKNLGIRGIPWSSEREVEELSELDIGIMPLSDDEWCRGKCACKALQYMALSIPVVVSDVGVNNQIIQDGVNGFLAVNHNDWVKKITTLIENEILRKKLGEAGYLTVKKHYSVNANKHKYIAAINKVLKLE